MLVCHCNSVTDREIRASIQRGARCLESVERACGAGAGCGGCVGAVEELLDEETKRVPRLPILAAAALVSG